MKKPLFTLCSAVLLTVTFPCSAEEGKDPFRNEASTPAAPDGDNGPAGVSVCYETFSLPLAKAAELMRSRTEDPALYAKLLELTAKNEAKQENFIVLRTQSGQKGTTESISEQIYPTETTPPNMPNSVSVSTPAGKSPENGSPATNGDTPSSFIGPANPTSFETRNVGLTLEIEPTISESREIIDLRMVPEIITFAGRSSWGQGAARAEMPEFESQRISSAYTLKTNRPFLLGTVSRPPVSKIDPDSANRVWFAFVTATLARP